MMHSHMHSTNVKQLLNSKDLNNMKKNIKYLLGVAIAGLTLAGCEQAKNVPTNYLDTTATSIYGRLSNFSAEANAVKAGDTLTFTVTPSEDFFIGTVTNNGVEWVLNSPEYKTFAMVQAVVSGKMITDTDKLSSEDINDNLVERITDDAQIDGYLQQMRDASPGKKLDFDTTNQFWFFDLVDHMYEGNVFIPVRVNSYINASLLVPSASKTKSPISDAMELHQQELMMRQQSLNNPGTRYVAPPQINFTE